MRHPKPELGAMNLVVMIADRMSEIEMTGQTSKSESEVQTTTDGGRHHGNGVSIIVEVIRCMTENALPHATLGKERLGGNGTGCASNPSGLKKLPVLLAPETPKCHYHREETTTQQRRLIFLVSINP